MPTIIILCLLLFITPTLHASPLRNKQQQLGTITQRIKTLEKKLATTQNKRDTIADALKQTDLDIARITKKLTQLKTRIIHQSKHLRQLSREAKKNEHALNKQQSLLTHQLQSAYALGNNNYLKVLLNQEDPSMSSRLLTFYQYLNRARLQAMNNIQQLLQKIDKNQQQLQITMQRLQSLKKQQQQKQQQQLQARMDQKKIVARLNQQITSKQQQLNNLLANKQALEKVIRSLRYRKIQLGSQSFVKRRGHLSWPTQGRISQHYGAKIGQSQLTSSGILIQAKLDQGIYAVHNGRVVFANWLRGFGLLLIVEHDHGYMTLYGHNNSLYKQTGDTVKAGELIATVGSSGGSRQSGLYFEIRYKGKPQNPELWCTKKA